MSTLFIFDMDGVIINSEPLHKEVELELRNELGFYLPEHRSDEFVGLSSLNMWQDLQAEFGFKKDPALVAQEGRVRFAEKLAKAPDVNPIPGVHTLLEALHERGIPKVLATSASRMTLNAVMDRFGFHHYFEHKVSGAELPRSKPDPMIFIKACQLMNHPPHRSVVIEDSKNGVIGAKKAGCYAIGYQNEGSGNQDLSLADEIIQDFNQLLEIKNGSPRFMQILGTQSE